MEVYRVMLDVNNILDLVAPYILIGLLVIGAAIIIIIVITIAIALRGDEK